MVLSLLLRIKRADVLQNCLIRTSCPVPFFSPRSWTACSLFLYHRFNLLELMPLAKLGTCDSEAPRTLTVIVLICMFGHVNPVHPRKIDVVICRLLCVSREVTHLYAIWRMFQWC
ncbi:hypothetical protein BO78DRAFT_180074 [Aspergillus sclerotiicarbonarius CBS 121057]|uniref:Uncharacterized protein n=1 Tax=Aspergillus sclerotiicarbonarius (strain CBS 121057 / IBT 28362) TaxID=1448318 RepID=A0A319FCR0_ASPSB|nr:hypothetical protein BO78DRAFT_180074 [Aspergillus sclerotiicarbonarius CBS 121057]